MGDYHNIRVNFPDDRLGVLCIIDDLYALTQSLGLEVLFVDISFDPCFVKLTVRTINIKKIRQEVEVFVARRMAAFH